MSSKIIDRFSAWYNKLEKIKQVYFLIVFCLMFLTVLWLGIHSIHFNARVYTGQFPIHIGQSSWLQFTDTLITK